MKALWVLAHPDSRSLNSRLRDVGVSALHQCGWTVEQTDLYRDRWNPILVDEGGCDVRNEQAKLRAADLLVLQFPLWWYGMPAIMKGWIDRVFEAGFAYDVFDPGTGSARKYGDGGLVGKRSLALVTAGDRPGSLGPRGISGDIEDVLWPLLHGTFWYTGMEALRPHLISAARAFTQGRFDTVQAELRQRLATIVDEPAIPYLPMNDEYYDHSIRLHPHISTGVQGNLGHQRPTRQ